MSDVVPLGSAEYILLFALLAMSRGADILSTWVATPHLVLEANPIVRKFGWRGSVILNVALTSLLAMIPEVAIIVATTSLLVAARNFQMAWVARSMGEWAYRNWILERLTQTQRGLYLFCLLGHVLMFFAVGAVLIWQGKVNKIVWAIGVGFIAYAMIVVFYTWLPVRRVVGQERKRMLFPSS